jgi:hypothetical protein
MSLVVNGKPIPKRRLTAAQRKKLKLRLERAVRKLAARSKARGS